MAAASETPALPKKMSGLGLASLVIGVAALPIAIIPCIGFLTKPVTAVGGALGLIALLLAVRSKRTGLGLPIAGLVVNIVAFLFPHFWVQVAESALEKERKEVREEKDPIKVSVTELAKAYKENEAAADKKYKDKVLLVTGKVEDIKSESLILTGEDGSERVTCEFGEKGKDELTKVKKGETVKVQGKCTGVFLNPQLKLCFIP